MLVAASSKAGVTEREAFYDILTDPSQKVVFLKKIKNIPAGVATTQSTSASPSYKMGMSSREELKQSFQHWWMTLPHSGCIIQTGENMQTSG